MSSQGRGAQGSLLAPGTISEPYWRVILGATYNGQNFRTPLEAQWAAFFDLAGWKWRVNPLRVGNWAPDFLVSFPCSHSECNGHHHLLIAVLPLSRTVYCNVIICNTGYYGGSLLVSPFYEAHKRIGYSIDGSSLFSAQSVTLPIQGLDDAIHGRSDPKKYKHLPPGFKVDI